MMSCCTLQCTDYMRANPSTPWASVAWTATTGIASGVLKCGDRVCVRNQRNNVETVMYVVDQGGSGGPISFDLDYKRVFSVLDPTYADYLNGKMNIDRRVC